ncbi:MAG: hypothetical protein JWN52_1720 [Actinomycetia bacterium]|jgi:hypothetical protein|nr:hypothetical protein [Actinomycetes bacterium]
MWLNVFIMGFASLFVGFVLGWVMARPRRWDRYVSDNAESFPARPEEDLTPLSSPLTTRT